jgi:hypothetical protein
MALTLTEAAKAIGRNRTTVFRAIKAGKISAIRDEATGEWMVEPAELFRLYAIAHDATETASGEMVRNGDSLVAGDDAMMRKAEAEEQTDDATAELRELRARLEAAEARIADKDETIADLRRRLDAEAEERRQAQARVMALLSPPPPTPDPPRRRRWWSFRSNS